MLSVDGMADPGSSRGLPVTCCSMFHNESGSAGRDRFNAKNRRQASGQSSQTGPLTASQASTVPTRHCRSSRGLRARRQSSASGPRKSRGYSFAEVPSPMSTPASQGTRRCQASSAAVANATANRSQLVKACTNSTGEAATIAASQLRRPTRW